MGTKKKKEETNSGPVLQVRVYSSERTLLDQPTEIIINDGDHNQVFRRTVSPGARNQPVEPQGNFFDNFTVLATSKGFDLQGLFVKIGNHITSADIMLIPSKPSFSFLEWSTLQSEAPKIAAKLAAGASDDDAARKRYEALAKTNGETLACMLNLMAALDQILFTNKTALDYVAEMDWNAKNARDRFFAWCQPEMLVETKKAAGDNKFAEEKGCAAFHPGSTCSYKQVDFGEANVQLTFHENDTRGTGQQKQIKVEIDIDYYKDLLAHGLMEVLVNTLTQKLTDPKQVYVLRWMAGRRAGRPEFAPPYKIVVS
jgi:hypothetical protein